MTGRLQDRVAIASGAASGIGRAIARRFAAEGTEVVIADLTQTPKKGGEPTHAQIERAGGTGLFLASDEARYIIGENLMVDDGWMAR